MTLQLLRANEGRPLPEVFHREALAAHFMISHPDYLEGIRARIINKDDNPAGSREASKRSAPWQREISLPQALGPGENNFIFKGEAMSYQTILLDQKAAVATHHLQPPGQTQCPEPRDALESLRTPWTR